MKSRSTTKSRQAFVNVSMPAPLRDRLTKKVQKLGSYGSTSDYIRDLIRRDLDRDQAMAKFDALITEGANSPGQLVTEQWWKDLRADIAERRKARTKDSAKKAPQRKRA
jgi:antitoxin ParD1/3/4